MKDEVNRITGYTGMSLNQKFFKGNDFKSQIVLDAINNLRVEPNEVILFYFSGHGFRVKENAQSGLIILTKQVQF